MYLRPFRPNFIFHAHHKTYYGRNLRISVISLGVCSCQAFSAQSNVCGQGRSLPQSGAPERFTNEARTCQSGAAPVQGWLLALPVNIGIGSKGLPTTNTVAYMAPLSVPKKKSMLENFFRSNLRHYRCIFLNILTKVTKKWCVIMSKKLYSIGPRKHKHVKLVTSSISKISFTVLPLHAFLQVCVTCSVFKNTMKKALLTSLNRIYY